MNLEQLTKHQIVLLTLLVSFVTSIATGIVTVSLMDQAPPGVTRVVNQIVEHTVEKVIPSTQGAAVVTTEKTVVVKDDDLATQSIAKVQKAVVRVVATGSEFLVSRGVIVDKNGVVLTDKSALAASGAESFETILPSGERVAAVIRAGAATTSPLAILDLVVGTSTILTAAPLADPAKLALGQTVIRIGGKGADSVANGVIASLPGKDAPELIEASVSSATPGSLLITLFGDVIGISTGTSLMQGAEYYSLAAPQKATEEPPASDS